MFGGSHWRGGAFVTLSIVLLHLWGYFVNEERLQPPPLCPLGSSGAANV